MKSPEISPQQEQLPEPTKEELLQMIEHAPEVYLTRAEKEFLADNLEVSGFEWIKENLTAIYMLVQRISDIEESVTVLGKSSHMPENQMLLEQLWRIIGNKLKSYFK